MYVLKKVIAEFYLNKNQKPKCPLTGVMDLMEICFYPKIFRKKVLNVTTLFYMQNKFLKNFRKKYFFLIFLPSKIVIILSFLNVAVTFSVESKNT
jgi:hypothetical protein